jgi:hypothetical protein
MNHDPSTARTGSIMETDTAPRSFRFCLTVTIVCAMVFLMNTSSHALTLEELRSGLPEQIMAWSKETEDRIYTPQTIFGYINGGAEVYKAYNLRRCLSRKYSTHQGPAIVLDIFDMGSSEDAYGVFTHDPAGTVVDLGQDGRWRPGWLNFWKDRFFVSIYTERETSAAQKAVKALGHQVDALVSSRGTKPKIIAQLPPQGLKAESIRYLHHPIILNYHYYISDENLLHLSPQTDAVLAGYQQDGGLALILLVSYPDPDAASRAHSSFNKHYLLNADNDDMVLLENKKWSASKVKGRLLAVVLEADSRSQAENLLQAVRFEYR